MEIVRRIKSYLEKTVRVQMPTVFLGIAKKLLSVVSGFRILFGYLLMPMV